MKKIAIVCLSVAVTTVICAVAVNAAGKVLGEGTIWVDSIQVGSQGVGGVTWFNGTILNDTTDVVTGEGVPVTFGDDVRIDGRLWRGATAGPGDGQPFQINDDLEVAGSLKAKSIKGLSNMVSSAGFAKTSDLSSYAKTKDLAPYAKTTDLSSFLEASDLSAYAKTSDLASYATANDLGDLTDFTIVLANNINAVYNYNRCVLNLGQYGTYPTISHMLFCWDLWVGTSLSASKSIGSDTTELLDIDQNKMDYSQKIQIEMDRALKK